MSNIFKKIILKRIARISPGDTATFKHHVIKWNVKSLATTKKVFHKTVITAAL